MLDGAFRGPVDRAVRPIGRALRRTGLSPDHLTFVGLAVAAASAVAVASGRLVLGLVLVIAAALPDLFDGALAKATQTSSQRGAFLDSTLDRVTDALLLGGIAWYLADYYSGRMALLPFAVSSVASVISYQRAKAESLGLEAKGGLMERAERIVALCLGLLLEAIGVDSALIWILWAMLALITITALQRFVKVWNQAEVAPATRERIDLRRERRIERRTVRADRVARSRTVVQRRMRNERRPR
ncbi:MAG: CDP-alcohol phosphatidyltransferase family protein [Actinomycetota bacterium]|jgi:CDP-diacylglycerol--glycerol-3-phosphate 3-phosphatidyltransferase|nr:CDP-alcohol phosphatidyltransferase family protein [Actinomycetota bacterium]MDA3029477.1 CDP-alcohol phosphatidyltransferase family protein [Actinomycetota bacterium]